MASGEAESIYKVESVFRTNLSVNETCRLPGHDDEGYPSSLLLFMHY